MRRKVCFLISILAFLAFFSSFGHSFADNGDTIVYKTNTGKCYHRGTCGYLHSKIEITLAEAVEEGLRPCSRCKPPKLDSKNSAKTPAPTIDTYVAYSSISNPTPKPTARPATSSTTSSSKTGNRSVSYATITGIGLFIFLLGRASARKTTDSQPSSTNSSSRYVPPVYPGPDPARLPSSQPNQKSPSRTSNNKTVLCPKCNKPMVLRHGKYGLFYGCSDYPHCRGTRSV